MDLSQNAQDVGRAREGGAIMSGIENLLLSETEGATPAEHLEARDQRLTAPQMQALSRVKQYIKMRDEQPLRGISMDEIHAIHAGTEFEGVLRLPDLRELVDALSPKGQP